MYDVIVIGAGPAGAAAARTLVAGGMKTLLIEKENMPRDKICCGILCKKSLDFVNKKFGDIPKKAYCSTNFIEGVAFYSPTQIDPVQFSEKELMANVWRAPFDCFLAINSGAEIRESLKVENIKKKESSFEVICRMLENNGSVARVLFETKYVIAADGTFSNSVRKVLPQAYQGLHKFVGVQSYYSGSISLSPDFYHTFRHIDIGIYSWVIIKDKNIVVGCCSKDVRKLKCDHSSFVSLLEKKYDLRIKKTVAKTGYSNVNMAPVNRFVLGKGNFLVAGEAAGFLNVLGEGISCALTTGDLAGNAILTALRSSKEAVDIYQKTVKAEKEECFNSFKAFEKSKVSKNI